MTHEQKHARTAEAAKKSADESIEHARKVLSPDHFALYIWIMQELQALARACALTDPHCHAWNEAVATLNKQVVDYDKLKQELAAAP